jgi:hypothetical protein
LNGIDGNIVVGGNSKSIKKMKVKELKNFIKLHRKGQKEKIRITGLKKAQLISIAEKLLDAQ